MDKLLPRGIQKLRVGICLLLLIALLYSKFLLSLSVIAFLLLGAYHRFVQKGEAAGMGADLWAFIGVFVLFLLSSVWRAEDATELTVRLRISLPFLALPLAWGWLPRWESGERLAVAAFAAAFFALNALGVLLYYFLNYAEMQARIVVSGAVPVPGGDHIRFSLMLVFALICAAWLALQYRSRLAGLAAFFLLIALHILAVRSGLLALYAALFVSSIWYILTQKRYLLGGGLLLLLCAAPSAAYYALPSFRTKIALSIHNYQLMQRGEIGNYADTNRFLSYKIAWQVFSESPILGVGMGNIRPKIAAIYARDYPAQPFLMPHNQILSYLVGMGIVGTSLFLLLFFAPLFLRRGLRSLPLLAAYTLVASSFLSENTLFISVGTCLCLFFLLFFRSFE